jgi:hypothetical protein
VVKTVTVPEPSALKRQSKRRERTFVTRTSTDEAERLWRRSVDHDFKNTKEGGEAHHFKAKPVPWSSSVTMYDTLQAEEARKRQERMHTRSQRMLASSEAPTTSQRLMDARRNVPVRAETGGQSTSRATASAMATPSSPSSSLSRSGRIRQQRAADMKRELEAELQFKPKITRVSASLLLMCSFLTTISTLPAHV